MYLYVCDEDGQEPVEIPCEEDSTVLISTINSIFSGCIGLKYRNPQNNCIRAVRLTDGKLFPPEGGWSSIVYIAVYPKGDKRSRSNDESGAESPSALNSSGRGVGAIGLSKRSAASNSNLQRKCTDLIVLGLPYKVTDEDVRRYFEQYGPLVMVQVKRDPRGSGQSRGYGFIRFQDFEAQQSCLATQQHLIDGRICTVKIPDSQVNSTLSQTRSENNKIFVGRITENITSDDLREYFSLYGKVIDVFIPKPFRSFAFVTFADAHVAEQLLGDDHIIKGISVHIGSATPKRIAAHPQHHQSPAFPSSAFNTLMGGGRAFRGQSSAFGGPAGASSVPSLGNSVAAAGFGGMQFGSSGQMAGHAPYWPVHNAAASASFSQMHAAAAPAGPPPHNSNAGMQSNIQAMIAHYQAQAAQAAQQMLQAKGMPQGSASGGGLGLGVSLAQVPSLQPGSPGQPNAAVGQLASGAVSPPTLNQQSLGMQAAAAPGLDGVSGTANSSW